MKKFILILSIISVLFLTGCDSNKTNKNNESNISNNDVSSVVQNNQQEEENEINIDKPSDVPEKNKYMETLKNTKWQISHLYDLNGDEIELDLHYGTGIHTYGYGWLEFKDDGTFEEIYPGVSAGNGYGTYTLSENELVLTYDENSIKESSFKKGSLEINNDEQQLILKGDNYTYYYNDVDSPSNTIDNKYENNETQINEKEYMEVTLESLRTEDWWNGTSFNIYKIQENDKGTYMIYAALDKEVVFTDEQVEILKEEKQIEVNGRVYYRDETLDYDDSRIGIRYNDVPFTGFNTYTVAADIEMEPLKYTSNEYIKFVVPNDYRMNILLQETAYTGEYMQCSIEDYKTFLDNANLNTSKDICWKAHWKLGDFDNIGDGLYTGENNDCELINSEKFSKTNIYDSFEELESFNAT